ncbi:hypothetical protein [Cognatishimia sp. MH4019]|uniref:hypothetical protein n=1 Tax=Cognatishimia sp. MH4019 TaxID=2854030 RepID=UPI001CD7695C|nr:hypothetical protein [Cognatishimia sp. MH4019]
MLTFDGSGMRTWLIAIGWATIAGTAAADVLICSSLKHFDALILQDLSRDQAFETDKTIITEWEVGDKLPLGVTEFIIAIHKDDFMLGWQCANSLESVAPGVVDQLFSTAAEVGTYNREIPKIPWEFLPPEFAEHSVGPTVSSIRSVVGDNVAGKVIVSIMPEPDISFWAIEDFFSLPFDYCNKNETCESTNTK